MTAIREFVQAVEMYQKVAHVSEADRAALARLQLKICDTEELRSLFVLLLRHYNPQHHSKQYLQVRPRLHTQDHSGLVFTYVFIKLKHYFK